MSIDFDRLDRRLLLVGSDFDNVRENGVSRERVAEFASESPFSILVRLIRSWRAGRSSGCCFIANAFNSRVFESLWHVEVELRLVRVFSAVLHSHVDLHCVILGSEQELLSVSNSCDFEVRHADVVFAAVIRNADLVLERQRQRRVDGWFKFVSDSASLRFFKSVVDGPMNGRQFVSHCGGGEESLLEALLTAFLQSDSSLDAVGVILRLCTRGNYDVSVGFLEFLKRF